MVLEKAAAWVQIKQSLTQIADTIMAYPAGSKLLIMAPVVRGRKGEYKQLFEDFSPEAFSDLAKEVMSGLEGGI